jgi:hypothetical protein
VFVKGESWLQIIVTDAMLANISYLPAVLIETGNTEFAAHVTAYLKLVSPANSVNPPSRKRTNYQFECSTSPSSSPSSALSMSGRPRLNDPVSSQPTSEVSSNDEEVSI